MHMHFCENQVIDSVISYYCALAERNTIPFHVQIDLPAQISVDETDFCLVLSNLLELIRKGIKTDGKAYTQSEIDLKSPIKDLPIIEKFQEIIGIEFDWSKFHNRREFKEYFWKLINE